MAKTKTAAKKTPAREESVRFRMSVEFKAWLEEFAAARQGTATDALTHGLMALAKAEGFKPPPRR
jgi:hypothetical protein